MRDRIIAHARRLRADLTDAERALWRRLRHRQLCGCRFRRQQPLGPYVVDFACLERRLVVEIDGSQHLVQAAADARRTEWLRAQGFTVLRFWNNEVLLEIDAVLERIRLCLAASGDLHAAGGDSAKANAETPSSRERAGRS